MVIIDALQRSLQIENFELCPLARNLVGVERIKGK